MPFHTSPALYYFVYIANICSSFNTLHKPCLLGSPSRVTPSPLCTTLYLVWTFISILQLFTGSVVLVNI